MGKTISAITLFFFCWSFLPAWDMMAYAAARPGRATGKGTPGAAGQSLTPFDSGAGKRFDQAYEQARRAVKQGQDKIAKGSDSSSEQKTVREKKAEIEVTAHEVRATLAATENQLRDAGLPKEILNRQKAFSRNFEEQLAEALSALDSIGTSKTSTELRSGFDRARTHFEKYAKKRAALDIPHHKNTEKKPRLKKDEFEKAFPQQKTPRTAGIWETNEQGISQIAVGSTLILKSEPSHALLAYNGSIDDLQLSEPLVPSQRILIASSDPFMLAQAALDLPTAADLSETPEVRFTQAITAKAQKLGNNPVGIYEWVRNNIEFVPTYGSIQGADGCLDSKACNAYDTASLLIALLRASNISSRYVYGTIEVPADRFMDWAGGFTDIQSAIRFVSSSGIPVAPVVSGGVISNVQLEHPWVEAWIDYNPSRGARHVTGDTWIPLDAGYKQHTARAGVDIAASVALDNQAFLQALGAGATADGATSSVLGGTCAASGQLMENYRVLAGNFLSQQHPNSSVGDVLGGSSITKQEFPYLLGTLPYRVYTAGVKASEMPDSLRNIINIRLLDAGIASLDVTRSLPEIAGKQISLGFVPATQADQDVILRYLPQGSGTIDIASLPQSLPAYLINVKPELRIGGMTVATGASTGLGKAMTMDIAMTTPGQGSDSTPRTISAGDYAVIMLETGTTTSGQLASVQASVEDTSAKLQSGITTYTREDIVGTTLQAAGLAYSAERAVKRSIIARSFNIRSMTQPSITLVSSNLDTTLLFGLPHSASGKGISLDIARDNTVAASRTGDLGAEKQFRMVYSLDASGLASRVLDDLLGGQAMGAVRALQAAKTAGVPVHTINQANISAVLPSLTLDAETITDIQNAVNSGLTVVTTRSSIAVSGKTITPLVSIDSLTGESAYLLNGDLNGSLSSPSWSIQSPIMNLSWASLLPRLSALSQSCLSDSFAANYQSALNGVSTIAENVAASSLNLLTQGIFYSAASSDLGCYLASTPAAPSGTCMASFSGSLCMADAASGLGSANAKPVANAGPARTVAVNSLVTLDGSGSSDQNNEPLTYGWTMIATPAGSSALLAGAASVSPTFTTDLPGDYSIKLVVSDGKSYSAPAMVTITASHPNVPVPNVVGLSQTEAEAAIIAAHLAVGAVSERASDTVPSGSVVSQDPAPAAVVVKGTPVGVILSSGPAVDKDLPQLTATFDRTPSVYNTGEQAVLYVDAKDDSGTVDIIVSVDSGTARTVIPPSTTIDTSSFALGSSHRVEVKATDRSNNATIVSLNLGIIDPVSSPTITAEILTPTRDAEVSAPVQIVGTVQSPRLLEYTLSYAPKGTTTFTTFAQGTTTVSNGALGTFDPTLLKNGVYDIRLTAVDTNGSSFYTDMTWRVSGDMKVGNFTVTFTDMSIPVAGLPVTVSRTYDSRDKQLRDFGIGWSVDIQNIKIDENRTPGLGWPQRKTGGVFGEYWLTGDTEHYVTVNLPDGRSEEFDLTLTPNRQMFVPIQQTTPGFAARPGTTSTLAPKNAPLLYVANDRLLDLDTLEPYDPQGYVLTDKDGMVYDLDQSFGVRSATDKNGNTVTYTKDGVNHSAGTGVSFVRDGKGRIAQIKGPDGSTVSYAYNSKDELVSVTDQSGNVTTYTYNRSHGLTSIKDPRGVTPVKNEYDNSGRLIAHTDSYGKRIEYTHDIAGRQEVVKDRNGNLTVFIYDEKGRVLQKTDPQGNITSFTYDTYGNKTSETNPLGNITRWVYDDKKNVLSETKIVSGQTITTSHTYNSLGKVLTTTDPLNHVTTNTYDAKGNLLTTTDALGNITTNTYDTRGNFLTTTDVLSNTTTYEYDGYGNRTKQTGPTGAVTSWTYDVRGNKLTDTNAKGGTTIYSYDASGRLTSVADSLGNITRTEYDTVGNKIADVNALGIRTVYYYDSANRLTATEYPDGTFTKTIFDNEGNRIASIDQDGRTTSYEYNGNKQLKKITYADTTTRIFGYDEAGRQTTITDQLGNITTKVYDDLGREIASVNPDGNIWQSGYDIAGNLIARTDPNGHTTTSEYDANNRITRTILPGGQTTEYAYDALGRKTSETDAANNTTEFGYDEKGNLNRVTDAEGGITRYEYDESNNRPAIVDARSNRTTFAYDVMNRLESKTMPNGGIETYTYDNAGRLATKTDAKGQAIQYGYDDLGRLSTRHYPDNSEVSFTYTNTGKRSTVTDHRGTTVYNYDQLNRLRKNTYSDGQYINYGYDATGKLATLSSSLTETVTYSYYNSGRLKEVKDSQNNISTYAYDAAGSRTGLNYPNGTAVSYTYDINNRLMNLSHKNSLSQVIASYAYTLGAIGNRTRIDEANGISRQYTYDKLYRLKNETVTDPANAQTYQNSYTYDAVGNRQNKTNTPYNQQAASNDYTYNSADQLLSENGITYTYDLNGNLKTKTDSSGTTTYVYNYDDRLVEVRMSNSDTVGYEYDADNNRVKTTTSASTTKYLVDTNRGLVQVLAEYTTSGTATVSYVYADDLVSIARDGQSYYYHFDGLGSTRLLTDSSGATTDTYDYDAFGNEIARTGTTENQFLFTGQQYDAETSQYYLRARTYGPVNGRFTSVDPYNGNIDDPSSLHKYLYAHANPVNRIDPSGLVDINMPSLNLGLNMSSDLNAISMPRYALMYKRMKSLISIGAAAAVAACAMGAAISGFTAIGSGNPCDVSNVNIFFSGMETPQTTKHIADALEEGKPAKLHRISPPHNRNWIYKTAACKGNDSSSTGLWCDEYPFASAEEGGSDLTTSTRLVPDWEQQIQGGKLGAFYTACKITPNQRIEGEFVVVPSRGPSLWRCK
ncbi:MAG: RHS repeat-associated core domain-containing protein [Nitrospirota bacterium]